MKENQIRSGVERFVDELLQTTGQMMLIVDHMARSFELGAVAGDAEPFDFVIRRLFTEVLEPEVGRGDAAVFEATNALLARARDVIGRELVLVEPGGVVDV
jgi:hypothetical protein